MMSAVVVAALLVGCGGQAAKSPGPTPSAAVLGETVVLPPVEPGVFNFKLTLLRVEAGDGFALRFDIPHADTNMFQFCDPVDNPCVKGKTYGFQFRPMGSGRVQYAFRREVRFGTSTMQVETFRSGTVDLAVGGEFVVTWPTG
jgi:hypothetical protein